MRTKTSKNTYIYKRNMQKDTLKQPDFQPSGYYYALRPPIIGRCAIMARIWVLAKGGGNRLLGAGEAGV